MPARTRGTADALATAHPVITTVRAFVLRRLVLPKKLEHTLALCTRGPMLARRLGVPQPPCPYAMLVPSDVRQGMEGLLP